jgi:putative ABC transport system substrate-binding protein
MWRNTVGLIVMLTLGILVVPRVSHAQQPAHVPRIGILMSMTPEMGQHLFDAFRHGLRDQGWVEGQTILLEPRWAEGKLERFADLAAELVRLKVELLFTPNTPGTRAAQDATRTIPIVAIVGDPIGAGFVASLARPGGNITGLTPGLVNTGKRLELLKELLPTASRVAVLWNPADQSNVAQWSEVQVAAQALDMTLHSLEARSAAEVEQVLAGLTREGVDALLVCGGYLTMQTRKQIVAMAAQQQLPAVYSFREFVEGGGLMGYSPNLADMYRRAATPVDKILKGATPAELPVEQAMKFDLVLNLQTAQALGVTFPPTLLILADEVIK